MMPEEIRKPAAEDDEMIGAEVVALIPRPQRPYRPKVVAALASALSALSDTFGMEMEMGEIGAEAVAELPADIARSIGMVVQAATDYGNPPPVALEEITDDAGLTVLTSWLSGLAGDEEFAAWLMEEDDAEMTEDEEMIDPSALFADRMR